MSRLALLALLIPAAACTARPPGPSCGDSCARPDGAPACPAPVGGDVLCEDCPLAAAAPGDVAPVGDIPVLDLPGPGVGTLVSGDRTLLFSDSPEAPRAPAVLARADLAAGEARVYLYHANGADQPMRFAVVLENPGAERAIVDLEQFAVGDPTRDYLDGGRRVASAYFASSEPARKSVPAGGAALLSTALDDRVVAPGELAHAILDLHLSAPVVAWTVAVDAGADTLATYHDLAPADRDADHQRGTYQGADRSIAPPAGCPLDPAAGATRLRLGASTTTIPEPEGIDELTGERQPLRGHYGIVYRIDLPIAAGDRSLLAALNPRGGAYAGAVTLAGGDAGERVLEVPSDLHDLSDNTQAILLDRFPPGSTLHLEWTAPGASNLPIDLLLIPTR